MYDGVYGSSGMRVFAVTVIPCRAMSVSPGGMHLTDADKRNKSISAGLIFIV